jgi:peptidoglycan hydrolase CwlO-like protein
LKTSLNQAERELAEAKRARDLAAQELAQAKAEAKVIEAHRGEFVRRERVLAENQAEEAALEVWAGKREHGHES